MMSRADQIAAVLCTTAAATAGTGISFIERAQQAGLTAGHAAPNINGLQFMSGGAAVGDFDRDGDQDVFVTGGPSGTDQLYINDGAGVFTDRAAEWGVAITGRRHSGAAVGDYNNDGYLDILVTCLEEGTAPQPAENRLYRNNGGGSFTDVALEAGVRYVPSGLDDAYSSAFGDYDLDGDLDLFITGWYGGNQLYRNKGDGTFSPVDASVFGVDSLDDVHGFSVRFTDIDRDGWPDLLIAADFYSSRVFLNNTDGTFTDATEAWGAGLDSNGMGHTQGDFDNDGLLDWYVTSRITPSGTLGSGNMLYMQNPGGTFTERSVDAGVNFGDWGWGADAADFDHDGWLDLVATNGWNGPYYSSDPTYLWRNTGGGVFEEIASTAGITHTGQGRGLLTFDADLDGDRDLLIISHNEPIAYYENLLDKNGTHALTIDLRTPAASGLAPDGFGTVVRVDTDGMSQIRAVDGGSNFLAQSELSAQFGLAASPTASTVTITWADGHQVAFQDVPAGRWTITANAGCPTDWDGSGIHDLADIQGWILGFQSGHPQADLTGDGVRDLADVQAFVSGFLAGCE